MAKGNQGGDTSTAAAEKEIPKYKLLEKSYIDDRLLDPENQPILDAETGERKPLIIEFAGIPGHHMEPMNAAARAMYEKYPPRMADPIRQLQIIGEAPAAKIE